MNEHRTLRRFLGRSEVRDGHRYPYRTLVDNVSLLRPELLVEIDQLLVESGHAAARNKAWRAVARAV